MMSDSNTPPLLIARQPYLNASRAVFGYELTYCLPSEDSSNPQQQAEQILTCLSDYFDPKVLANHRCIFVRLTPQTILDQSYQVLPPDITVIELNAVDLSWDEQLTKACGEMRQAGFRLCLVGTLDHLQQSGSHLTPTDFFKVNAPADINAANCSERLASVRPPQTAVIASGIEQPQQFEAAKSAGFDLFEGYFFFKPQVLEHREIPSSQINRIQFIQAVNQPDIDVKQLEELIRSDAALSVGLMRLVNSAAFGISQQITSIQRALLLLGPKKVRQWATSLVTRDLAGDKPEEIVAICLTRAFFCESLGGAIKSSDSALDLFMIGIISGLPAMLDVPMLKLLDELSVPEEIRSGLRGDDSSKGRIFTLALAHENGAFTAMTSAAAEVHIDLGELAYLYQASVKEVQAILGQSRHAVAA